MNSTFKTKKFSVILFLIISFYFSKSFASFELKGYGARSRAMGQAYVGLANTPDALFLNCSGTSQIFSPSFSFFITRPFGLKELTYFSFAGVLPTSIGNLATAISEFGNEIYQEQSIVLNYSRLLNETISLGLNLHYMKLHIKGYGSDFSLGLDFGFLVKLNSKLNWGFFTTNINRAGLGQSNDKLPQTFVTGVSFIPLDNLTINFDLYEELSFPLELRGGVEYVIFDKLALRSGFITETGEFCFGLGFISNKFSCDYAVNTHPDLGLTHQFSLQIVLKK